MPGFTAAVPLAGYAREGQGGDYILSYDIHASMKEFLDIHQHRAEAEAGPLRRQRNPQVDVAGIVSTPAATCR